MNDKILLEYYRLGKDFDGEINLETSQTGFRAITGEAGRKEKKKDPLTDLIDTINKKYGTNFTDMDKVFLQIQNDYANKSEWQNYAKNNDRNTFMLLFEQDFPEMAANRYEKNDEFFLKMFSDKEMMQQIMLGVGTALYQNLIDSFNP